MKGTLLFFVMLALISCVGDEELMRDSGEVPFNTIVRIKQGEFSIIDGPQLSLKCETEQWYPCTMYGLMSEESIDQSKISITFTKIVKPEICFQMGSPAIRFYPLDGFENGEYEIELNRWMFSNKGKLTITDDEMILDIPNPVGIEVISKVVRRTPKYTYLGYVLYDEHSRDSLNQLLDRISDVDGVKGLNDQVPGVYTYHAIDENGELIDDSGFHDLQWKSIVFQYQGDDRNKFREELMALINAYRHTGLYPEVGGI